jgi:glycosyltransferase involved in cell wall biosynthesis
MVLLEAMALKRPVIATAVGGIPEVIENNVSGILVPVADEKAMSDALLGLSADSGLRSRIGEAAEKRIVHSFSTQTQSAKIKTIYREVLGRA